MIVRNFCVFEGIDGTGTTTQLMELKRRFQELGDERVCFTNEPTDHEIGKLIRRCLRGESSIHPETLARLFAADRCEHVYGSGGIVQSSREGRAIFSDRYLFSSIAYQGEAAGIDLAKSLNKDFPLPEYLFFFDLDPDAAMDRVEKRAGTLEIFEKREFQKRVRERYKVIIPEYAQSEPAMKVIYIDASESVEAIAEKIWSVADKLPIL